jgi:hypothetical protein
MAVWSGAATPVASVRHADRLSEGCPLGQRNADRVGRAANEDLAE